MKCRKVSGTDVVNMLCVTLCLSALWFKCIVYACMHDYGGASENTDLNLDDNVGLKGK